MCTNLSLARRLTLVTGGISSILPRDQLGAYTHSSGSLIGSRHWLGSVLSGAYIEQPTNNWLVSALYTKEKSWEEEKKPKETVNNASQSRFSTWRDFSTLHLYVRWLWAAEPLLHLHLEMVVEQAAIQQGEACSCLQAVLSARVHRRISWLIQGGWGGKHLMQVCRAWRKKRPVHFSCTNVRVWVYVCKN